jgi:hypothetical protein
MLTRPVRNWLESFVMGMRRSKNGVALICLLASLCAEADSSSSLLLRGSVAASSALQATVPEPEPDAAPNELLLRGQGNYASGFTISVSSGLPGDDQALDPLAGGGEAGSGTSLLILQAN